MIDYDAELSVLDFLINNVGKLMGKKKVVEWSKKMLVTVVSCVPVRDSYDGPI